VHTATSLVLGEVCTRGCAFCQLLGTENRVAVESTPAFTRIDGEICQAYNEVAFRYFLEIERKRAERSLRPLLLILVKLRRHSAYPAVSAPQMFAKVFSALDACVREVDLVGWYREGVIAAAVLVAGAPASELVRNRLRARVLRVLRERLSPDEAARVHVRVVAFGHRPRM